MGIFSCERCGQAFSKKYNYDQHMKRKVICKIIPKPLTAPTSEIFLEAPESHHLPPTAYMSSPYRPTASFVVPTAPAPAPVPVMPPKRTVAIPLSDETDEMASPLSRASSYSAHPIPDFDMGVESAPKPGRGRRPNVTSSVSSGFSSSSSSSSAKPKEKADIPVDDVDWDHLSRAIRRQEEELEALRVAAEQPGQQNAFKHPIENVQVTYVGQDDDFFDILTKEVGDEEKVLRFIMSCAQDGLAGDWRLLNRVYFDKKKTLIGFPITCINSDRNRGKYEFIDEMGARVFDKSGALLSKRLARSLQNTYLKISNRLIKINIARYVDPMKFLAENDLQAVNVHVEQLSTETYQKKILGTLKYPNDE
jgi:hypothetical protein